MKLPEDVHNPALWAQIVGGMSSEAREAFAAGYVAALKGVSVPEILKFVDEVPLAKEVIQAVRPSSTFHDSLAAMEGAL